MQVQRSPVGLAMMPRPETPGGPRGRGTVGTALFWASVRQRADPFDEDVSMAYSGSLAAPAAPTTTASTGAPAPTASEVDHLDVVVEPLAVELALVAPEDEARRSALRERIVLLALPLADGVATRYRGRGIDTDDLVQVARTALVKAVRRYRPGAGPGFAAYATPTISGEVKRWFRDHGWAVRPPRRIQELRVSLLSEEERLRHALGRHPAEDELACALGVTRADVGDVRRGAVAYHATSLDEPVGDGDLGDLVLVTECPSGTLATRDALRRAIAVLPDRQRLVLSLRFVDELTQSEIGERIGVSQMQVSRILRATLDRLRDDLADEPAGTGASTAA
ncbi:sigma-70 family RNA polymerase sigma factor [Oryzobacter telluris]|uniref:sigma-70 family RNA polymerase sigma factor n=1 Tax=Oryzobacter telluris TaxID=3149179 RepID=UPI00370D4FBF